MANILITGGQFFIGSHISRYIIEGHPEDNVVCVDCKRDQPNTLDEISKNERLKMLEVQSQDYASLKKIFEESNIDYVCNCQQDIKTVEVMLRLVVEYKILKFHQISSAEVYGVRNTKRNVKYTEEMSCNPNTPLGTQLLEVEKYIENFAKEHAVSYSISRSSKIFGLDYFYKDPIAKTIYHALRNEKIPAMKGDFQRVQWLFIDDFCSYIDHIIREPKYCGIFNIASAYAYTTLEMKKAVLKILKKPFKLLEVIKAEAESSLLLNDMKVEKVVGFHNIHKLDSGIRLMIEWQMLDRFEKELIEIVKVCKKDNL